MRIKLIFILILAFYIFTNLIVAEQNNTTINTEYDTKWFFEWGGHIAIDKSSKDIFLTSVLLPITAIIIPDIGFGYNFNTYISSSINIGLAFNYTGVIYAENKWLYNFINDYNDLANYILKVYIGGGFGMQKIYYYKTKDDNEKVSTILSPSISGIVGTRLTKKIVIEYIYRYSIINNTYIKKNSGDLLFKLRWSF